jgi:hypothetical protein
VLILVLGTSWGMVFLECQFLRGTSNWWGTFWRLKGKQKTPLLGAEGFDLKAFIYSLNQLSAEGIK